MKFSMLAGCLVSLLSLQALASEAKSIYDSSRLMSLLRQMSRSAEEGASLEHFGYSETFADSEIGNNCSIVSSQAVVKEFTERAVEILRITGQRPDHLALRDFSNLMGTENYWRCLGMDSNLRSFTTTVSYVSTSGDYRLQLSFGYED